MDSWSEIFKLKNNMLDQHNLPLEAARQWVVLLIGLGLLVLFSVSIVRLHKTQRNWTFDLIILLIESCKVLLFMIYEFLVFHMVMLLAVFIFQSFIRAIVCGKFIIKGLELAQKE